MKRIFLVEADLFTNTDFQMIHRYIRKRLDSVNKDVLVIKSIPLTEEAERLIFTPEIR